jgi:hypothetical protein
MSYKSLKSKKARQAKQKIEAQAAEEKRVSRRGLMVLGALLSLMLCIGAFAHWRNLLNLDSVNLPIFGLSKAPALVVAGTPPPLPSNKPSKEFIYSPYAGD